MLPIRCSQPPWRNIEVQNGRMRAVAGTCNGGPLRSRTGTTPNEAMKASRFRGPRDNSKKKASTFKMMRLRFTIGKLLDGTLSLKGIMAFLFLTAFFVSAAGAAPQGNATYDQA